MGRRSAFRSGSEYVAARTSAALLKLLPEPLADVALKRIAGPLGYMALGRYRRQALHNLSVVFGGETDPHWLRDTACSVFEQMTRVYYEFLACSQRTQPGLQLRIHPRSMATYRRLRSRMNPVVFVTAHLGNWEILGAWAGQIGLPVHSVARQLDNPLLDRWLKAQRQRWGQVIHRRNGAVRALGEQLDIGCCVALLVDQHTRRGAVRVPFLGREAALPRAPAVLALRAGVPVVPTCLVRNGPAGVLTQYFGDPVFPNRRAPLRDEVRRITQAYSETLGQWIREYPTQWLWLHRRWRN